MLNLPLSIGLKLKDCKNILILNFREEAFLASIPIFSSLKKLGKKVHLATFSSADINAIREYTEPVILDNIIFGVTAVVKTTAANYQEGQTALWIKQTFNEDVPVWMISKADPKPLSESFKRMVHHLGIDAIIVVDSGINSIVTGLETDCPKSIIDSTVGLFAIRDLEVPVKMLFTIGMNPEMEGQLCYFEVMRNVTRMQQQGGMFGTCSLMNYMQCYQQYKNLIGYIQNAGGSVGGLNMKIISSVDGIDMDDPYTQEIYSSPLTSQYWLFDASAAIYNNKFMEFVESAESYYNIVQAIVPRLKKS